MFTPSVQDLLHLMSHLAPTGSQHRPKEEEDLSGGLGHKPWEKSGTTNGPSNCAFRRLGLLGKSIWMSKQSIHCVLNELHSMERMSKQSIQVLFYCRLVKEIYLNVEAVDTLCTKWTTFNGTHVEAVDTSIILLQTRKRNHVPGMHEGCWRVCNTTVHLR